MTKKPFEIGLVIQLQRIDCDQNKACEAKSYTPIAYRLGQPKFFGSQFSNSNLLFGGEIILRAENVKYS